jgi:hypothetical protein
MTKEEFLEESILAHNKSVMAFAKEIGVPYTTIKGMLTRGVDGASVQTVIKVCNGLNIDIESLMTEKFDVLKGPANSQQNEISLSEKEIKMIKKYRLLDQRGQQAVDDTLGRELSYILRDNNMVEMSEIASDAIDTIDKIAEAMHKNQHNTVLKK